MTIIKKFEPEKQEKQKFPKLWIGMTAVFLLILILVEIWVNNTTVSFGAQFEKLESLKRILEMENQLLENEISKNASLLNISSKSAELGFSSPSSIQYIR